MKPYIGVTGFTKKEEVSSALSVFPKNYDRELMVGVCATWKSLRYLPIKPKWQKQTPSPLAINELFLEDSRVLNLVHYSTEEGQERSILNDMVKIHNLAGWHFHGFQLNIAWPEVRILDEYRNAVGYKYRVVLQIGQKAVEMAGGTPESVADKFEQYAEFIDDVLLDPSGGQGKSFDTERTREFLTEIRKRKYGIGLGVAGGLGPDTLNLVEPLIADFPNLNIDAQGKLRNSENDLDVEAMKTYLVKAVKMFG